jgi:hypothetical protein
MRYMLTTREAYAFAQANILHDDHTVSDQEKALRFIEISTLEI